MFDKSKIKLLEDWTRFNSKLTKEGVKYDRRTNKYI